MIREQLATTDEQRAALGQRIVAECGFPADWLGTRMVPEGRDGDPLWGYRALTQRGNTFAWFARDSPGAEAALRQRLAADPCAEIGVLCEGPRSWRVLRKQFAGQGIDWAPPLERYLAPAPRAQARRQPLTERLEPLFWRANCLLRELDGLHDDEALDELCKLLSARLHDERAGAPDPGGALERSAYGLAEEFAADVRALHERAERSGASGARAPLRLSSSALCAVAELLEPYSLLESPLDVRGRAFQRILDPTLRASLGQFFTPDAVVRFMVDAVAPAPGESVLDPFCGSALFLRRAAERGAGRCVGIEKSERMIRVASAAAALEGSRVELLHADALVDPRNLPGVPTGGFDAVLTNPPFGALLGRDALARLGRFDLAGRRSRVPLEILGLERSVALLRPGGRLGIVVPEGLLGNRATRDVRSWLAERAHVRALVALPVAAFAPYGAALRTCLVFARRLGEGEPPVRDGPVFLGRVDRVGHDAAGRPQASSDWPELLDALRQFLAREGW